MATKKSARSAASVEKPKPTYDNPLKDPLFHTQLYNRVKEPLKKKRKEIAGIRGNIKPKENDLTKPLIKAEEDQLVDYKTYVEKVKKLPKHEQDVIFPNGTNSDSVIRGWHQAQFLDQYTFHKDLRYGNKLLFCKADNLVATCGNMQRLFRRFFKRSGTGSSPRLNQAMSFLMTMSMADFWVQMMYQRNAAEIPTNKRILAKHMRRLLALVANSKRIFIPPPESKIQVKTGAPKPEADEPVDSLNGIAFDLGYLVKQAWIPGKEMLSGESLRLALRMEQHRAQAFRGNPARSRLYQERTRKERLEFLYKKDVEKNNFHGTMEEWLEKFYKERRENVAKLNELNATRRKIIDRLYLVLVTEKTVKQGFKGDAEGKCIVYPLTLEEFRRNSTKIGEAVTSVKEQIKEKPNQPRKTLKDFGLQEDWESYVTDAAFEKLKKDQHLDKIEKNKSLSELAAGMQKVLPGKKTATHPSSAKQPRQQPKNTNVTPASPKNRPSSKHNEQENDDDIVVPPERTMTPAALRLMLDQKIKALEEEFESKHYHVKTYDFTAEGQSTKAQKMELTRSFKKWDVNLVTFGGIPAANLSESTSSAQLVKSLNKISSALGDVPLGSAKSSLTYVDAYKALLKDYLVGYEMVQRMYKGYVTILYAGGKDDKTMKIKGFISVGVESGLNAYLLQKHDHAFDFRHGLALQIYSVGTSIAGYGAKLIQLGLAKALAAQQHLSPNQQAVMLAGLARIGDAKKNSLYEFVIAGENSDTKFAVQPISDSAGKGKLLDIYRSLHIHPISVAATLNDDNEIVANLDRKEAATALFAYTDHNGKVIIPHRDHLKGYVQTTLVNGKEVQLQFVNGNKVPGAANDIPGALLAMGSDLLLASKPNNITDIVASLK